MAKITVIRVRLSLCTQTLVLWCDNLVTKSMVKNPIFHSRTKHIEIDVHFVREKVENGDVDIRYVPTLHQVADIFTKGLSRDRFVFLCTKLGLKRSPMSNTNTDPFAAITENLPPTSTAESMSSSSMELDLRGNVKDISCR